MNFWYRKNLSLPARLLLPLSWLTGRFVRRRFRHRHRGSYGVPVLVVGNLTVGGTGKSPAIQALITHLQSKGLRCGIVSRGYGGHGAHYPLTVTENVDADQCGDEPKAFALALRCPVVVDPDRHRAVNSLTSQFSVDVVVSDDGLQHYPMGRDLELIMIDGVRGLGNGWLLPAGPLREPLERLNTVDWCIGKGREPDGIAVDGVLSLNPQWPVNQHGTRLPANGVVRACAGIGHPESFYRQLAEQGFELSATSSPGDHQAVPQTWLHDDSLPLVVTEKDAVKLPTPWPDHCFVVRLEPTLPGPLLDTIESAIRSSPSWQP